MRIKNLKFTIIIFLGIIAVTSGFRCKFITPGEQKLLEPIELTWWGTFDDPQNFIEIIADYRLIHPNIKINYRKLREEEFEKELLDALAEDRGPDIFSIKNYDLDKWQPKIEPLPATITMAYQVTKKSLGIKEETLTEIRETNSLTSGKIKERFLDVVYGDAVREEQIYGLPLSVDTLVMFYNRDLFNNAGLPLPPKTWPELQVFTKKLTYQDNAGNLIQSGTALGTAENIENYTEILSLLMMQNGAQMMRGDKVFFYNLPSSDNSTYNPGPEALRFYTDFAGISKEVYTWNNSFSNSIDSFVQGKVAIIFGYNYHLPFIEAKRQGKLNYAVAPTPQIEGRNDVNIANYWLQSVSKKSEYINEAWDFLQFATSQKEVEKYLETTKRPAALRALIENQINSDELTIFAQQLLTSTSWYHGKNYQAVQSAFAEMINSMLAGTEAEKAAQIAAQKIQQTL